MYKVTLQSNTLLSFHYNKTDCWRHLILKMADAKIQTHTHTHTHTQYVKKKGSTCSSDTGSE